jgi:hypothetical protein
MPQSKLRKVDRGFVHCKPLPPGPGAGYTSRRREAAARRDERQQAVAR